MISYGPVPSRRLGKSLGINNIPSLKVCSYSCIYCQVGITTEYSFSLQEFYPPEIIYSEVEKHLESLKNEDHPDYLTIVSNGEPTLDINLGKTIKLLKRFGIPIAVITNASLLNLNEVRENLSEADWVSVKVDTNNKEVWQKINRPYPKLKFKDYLAGLSLFSKNFKGILNTETMLIEGINDRTALLSGTADLISEISPSKAYISIPTRPTAIKLLKAPSETVINKAFHIFSWKVKQTELLLGFEGINMGTTGNPIDDIVNTCTVHPLREDALLEILKKNNTDRSILKMLIDGNYIEKVHYQSHSFYIRKFHIKE